MSVACIVQPTEIDDLKNWGYIHPWLRRFATGKARPNGQVIPLKCLPTIGCNSFISEVFEVQKLCFSIHEKIWSFYRFAFKLTDVAETLDVTWQRKVWNVKENRRCEWLLMRSDLVVLVQSTPCLSLPFWNLIPFWLFRDDSAKKWVEMM